MVKKKEEKQDEVVFSNEDVRGTVVAWVQASQQGDTPVNEYLTKSGAAYLNGYLQASNTVELIKIEKYNEVLEKQEDLIIAYENQSIIVSKLQTALDIQSKPWWKRW